MTALEARTLGRLEWLRRVLGLASDQPAPPRPATGCSPADGQTTAEPGAGMRTPLSPRCQGALLAAGLVLALAAGAEAQDERRLKQVFEGKRVTVLIDMPATSQGVDLFPGSSRPLDYQKYASRLKENGTAIKEGERSIITKIRVKDNLIEIQLGGGGYGTFGDILGSALSNQGADSGAAQQLQKSNERTQRLASGSRFNLRYPNGITPDDLEPEAIVAALAEYATFPATVTARSPSSRRGEAPPAAETAPAPGRAAAAGDATEPRKGMAVDEVERLAGSPQASSTNGPVETRTYASHEVDYYNGVAVEVRKRGGSGGGGGIRKGMSLQEVEALAGRPLETSANGPVTTHKYRWQDATLEADFVNGVLVGYRIVAR